MSAFCDTRASHLGGVGYRLEYGVDIAFVLRAGYQYFNFFLIHFYNLFLKTTVLLFFYSYILFYFLYFMFGTTSLSASTMRSLGVSSFNATKMVSAPAMVPSTSGIVLLSMFQAMLLA